MFREIGLDLPQEFPVGQDKCYLVYPGLLTGFDKQDQGSGDFFLVFRNGIIDFMVKIPPGFEEILNIPYGIVYVTLLIV